MTKLYASSKYHTLSNFATPATNFQPKKRKTGRKPTWKFVGRKLLL